MKRTRTDLMTTARMRAKQAIEAGDEEAALKAVDDIWEEGRPIHDLYGDMAAVFLDYIKEKRGEVIGRPCAVTIRKRPQRAAS